MRKGQLAGPAVPCSLSLGRSDSESGAGVPRRPSAKSASIMSWSPMRSSIKQITNWNCTIKQVPMPVHRRPPDGCLAPRRRCNAWELARVRRASELTTYLQTAKYDFVRGTATNHQQAMLHTFHQAITPFVHDNFGAIPESAFRAALNRVASAMGQYGLNPRFSAFPGWQLRLTSGHGPPPPIQFDAQPSSQSTWSSRSLSHWGIAKA